MDVKVLVAKQIAFDKAHGFPVEFDSLPDKYTQISKDLVGLVGEIGEFANVVKKVMLHLDRPAEYPFRIGEAEACLSEELIDVLIYTIRLAAILDIDIEEEYEKKLSYNLRRYERLG